MRSNFSSFTLVLAACALGAVVCPGAAGQNREKFLISAQAGGVNAISGRVEVRSTSGADWQFLNVTDDLRAGDFVRTGRDGLVELLLNPGSFLRMAENSEFQLTNNSLEALEVRLGRGTAIIEATGREDTELAINITTPHAKMVIVRRGLYRVNVVPGDNTELIVRKGRVVLADSHTKIKSGNKVIFSSNTFSVAKLKDVDKQKDTAETWSRERAKTVALANQRVSPGDLNSFLANADSWSTPYSRWSGLWFFNSRYKCFSFLPYNFGWDSPYGQSYSNVYWGGGWNGTSGGIVVNNPANIPSGPGSNPAVGPSGSPGSSGPVSAGPAQPSRGGEITPPARNIDRVPDNPRSLPPR